jgi:hypothetical protein
MKQTTILFATTLAAFAGSTTAFAAGCPNQAAGVTVTLGRAQVTPTGYTQFIYIQNGPQKLSGPAYLILDNVPPGATLTNRSGHTDCGIPAGQAPFMRINLGPSGALYPNQEIQAMAFFLLEIPGVVIYNARLVMGNMHGHGVTWGDYDGDGKADRAVLDNNGLFRVHYSGSNDVLMSFPLPWQLGGMPIVGDFDGDGIADPALFRPSTSEFIVAPIGKPAYNLYWGTPGIDKPVVGDYDGDGKADIAVYNKTNGNWTILRSTSGALTVNWGLPNVDFPVPADYDGDGVTDIAVYRPTTAQWFIIKSSTGVYSVTVFGFPGEQNLPIVADYDGDGKADLALWREELLDLGYAKDVPCNVWRIILSSARGGVSTFNLGFGFTHPSPADYDGDGRVDPSVYILSGQFSKLLLSLSTSPGQFGFKTGQVVDWPELGQGQAVFAIYNWYK